MERSTLVGVATGTPDGGVAIVRLSGPQSGAIVGGLVGTLPAARRASLRALRLPGGVEQVLVVSMPGPGSFTGEDVVELHVHGGDRNVSEVVRALLSAGAVAAGAGAFTRRAFEHGKLSLDQAEGIAALVAAQTDAALDQARRLVSGELSEAVRELDAVVTGVRHEVEANLDFPDDVREGDPRVWAESLGAARVELERWLASFERGRRERERARVVLAGPPNAGKSALFNALLGRDRAIVSEHAGTTRDYVEGMLELGRSSVVLVDTAGLRLSEDGVEMAGVEHAQHQVAGADLVVWVEAVDTPRAGLPPAVSELDQAGADGSGRRFTVESKADLGTAQRPGWLRVSTQQPGGVDVLRDAIGKWIRGSEPPWIGLARHRDRTLEALQSLDEALVVLARQPVALELVAFLFGIATTRLREIDGRSSLGPVGGDVLDGIFARFCIGK